MNWISRFQLFLFDFDGLLVNTEHLHFQAYINMLSARECFLDWSYSQFCEVAHLNNSALKEALYAKFPALESNWNLLYEEKKAKYLELLSSGKVELMPGVQELLFALRQAGITCCVVTNSPKEQIDIIRSRLPALQIIAHWVTREQYSKPKPDPECYLKAIELYGKPLDRVIGFEDSIRGFTALQQTKATAVLICPSKYPLLQNAPKSILHFESFLQIPENCTLHA